ncbi:MAG: ATP-dependent helicase [Cyclobacteriaceae bacterium]
MDYLETLNPEQKKAVLHTSGPSMIIAGAGSGKTRVLTYRIAHLINTGVDSFNILSLTFTNKASKDMRERIESVVGTEARNIWMGTFHSVFARILRMEADRIGYPQNFTIYDTDDSLSLIRTILKEKNLDDKVYKPRAVLNRISGAKNRLLSANEYLNNVQIQSDDIASMKPEMGRIYKWYQERCFRAGAMDFDDLLFNTNVLFRDHLDVLNKYQTKFKHVLVDEFQDTNLSQYAITRKLAAQHRNITVVGDDAQSIYGFRGADIQNILNFEKDYDELETFKLEQNYRSTSVIVEAANSVINKNTQQLDKKVWTSNAEGDKIKVLKATSDNEEGRLVANSIFEKKNNTHLNNKDFAILYRTNSQSRSMEEALRKLNIKYRIFGGLSFYQRKEIKDLIAYFRFTVNTQDEEAFKRTINYPKRGIGTTSVSKVIVFADDHGTSIWETITNIGSVMSGRAAAAIDSYTQVIKSFQIAVQTKDAFEAATQIAKESGVLKTLYEDKTIEGVSRYENIQELLNGIKEFVDDEKTEDKSLAAYLQDIALLTDADKDKQDPDVVSLMTIHSSKGLEFKHVYMVGMEEELFPSQMMLSSKADLEEERRLFYVAITRAEKNLTLSYAITRYRFGSLRNCEASRFIEEIDPRFLDIREVRKREAPNPSERKEGAVKYSGLISSVKRDKQVAKKVAKPYTPSADFAPSDTSNLQVGMKVEHPKFGYGKVSLIDTEGNNRKAKVKFESVGEKTLLLTFAKLRITDN